MADLKYTGAQVEDALGKALSATQPTDIAKVATSGSYNDLKDKPTIPSAVTVDASLSTTSTNPVQNKAVAAGINAKYTKPTTGIPKSDLASAVQTSLGKADTALQSEQYKGTVTGVKVNGSTKTPSSGTVDIGSVVTGVKINGSTKSPSNGVVDLGTVITSHQDISGKQDKLVSGTNIKTLNGQSILGSGDLAIGGGDSGIINAQMIYPQVEGNEYVYRIPSGVFCELFFNPNEAQASGIQYIVVVFDNPPEVSVNENAIYDGNVSYAKYHFVVTNYGCPIGFFIENVAKTFPFTNGGAPIDSSGFMFEMDALCNIIEFDGARGGYIYGTSATYTYEEY